MPFTLTMPKLSPTMEGGTIIKWHKQEGDPVLSGDLLFEVATDKATVEHCALDEGWIRLIFVKEGEEALVNQPIALMTAQKEESLEGFQLNPLKTTLPDEKEKNLSLNLQPPVEELKASKQSKENSFQRVQFTPEPPLQNYTFEYGSKRQEGRILASPLAKALAKEKGLDLSSVKGTGPNQRIVSQDLERALPKATTFFGQRQNPALPPGAFEEQPLTPIRKVISQRLQDSKSSIPHFYVSQTIDADSLVKLREDLKSHHIKHSINDFIVRACALALKKHPLMNSGFNSANQTIIHFQTIDIAFAVSIEGGIITPILRHADFKSLGELALEIHQLAQKAREKKLTPEEFKGGSFTISNLGMYGIPYFQAIINPPQAAILAVGAVLDVPVVRNQHVVPGKTLMLTLSVDHRVIDGVLAAQFLQTLKELLESPALLIMS